jgi:Nuclease-related domain/UvrD-like helicase C-terminal domain/PhoH-like protein
MIPAGYDRGRTAPGEQIVFERLRSEPETRDWIVLHSLDVADHSTQVQGEIDFVIIVPGLGVLCLEVKSHHAVGRTAEGEWRMGADPPTFRSPFRQASDSMHSIRRRLADGDTRLSGVPFASAVCFTHVSFREASPEWGDWQVIDQRTLAAGPMSGAISRALEENRRRIASSPKGAWLRAERPEPTAEQAVSIARQLRPAFEFFESPRSRQDRTRDELRLYTAEQLEALARLDANERVLFEGAAGTGKTMMAIEAARRSVNAGTSTALVCFNRMLASWLEEQCGPLGDRLWVGTMHSLMLEIAGVRPPDAAGPDYWTSVLPQLAVDQALGDEAVPRFGTLIVDEAQDLLRPAYLDALDLQLWGGLGGGRWRMFGDFVNQAIYDAGPDPLGALTGRCPGVPRYSLTENCRNTPRIATQLTILTGAPSYRHILRPDNGLEPELRLYRDDNAQADLLRDELERIRELRYSPAEVVVLSPKADGVATTIGGDGRLGPMTPQARRSIRRGTIQSFKGLESPVVIVTDIERIGDAASDALLYVAISRATDRLTILGHESIRGALVDRLQTSPA